MKPDADPLEPVAEPATGSKRSVAVAAYVLTVFGVGVAGFAWTLIHQLPRVDWLAWSMAGHYLLTVLLVVGELRPLLISRGDGDTDRVTVSSTFAVALVLDGPLALALIAQTLAVGFDDVWRRRRPLHAMFNVGQYLLTLLAARLVFSLISQRPFAEPTTGLEPHHILPALAAAATYFLVNNGAVAIVVALDSGQRVLHVLREDIRVQSLTSSILLGLGPVAAVIADFSLLMLPLLVLPLIGVQHNAWIAAQRAHDALHDGLTDLPNRELFRRRSERAIDLAAAVRGRLAVMLLDLDHFKEVNDTLGHHVGDGLLREVARRVASQLPEGTTLARLGGDEFAVLVPQSREADEVQALAERVISCLMEPVIAEDVKIGVQASIGIARYPEHGDSIDTLLQRADIALYLAKANRGEIQVYRPEIDQHTVMRLSLLGDLHAAVDSTEFEMLFQPQVNTVTGRVVSVEALMRWQHPLHGMISPDVFIPLAENTGVISPLTRTAMQQALSVLSRLRRDGHDVSVAVNMSARLLSDLELPSWVSSMLMSTGIPASRLTIEVTETTIAADPQRTMQVLQDLREIGVRLAVDDFGTGYSSLSYLRRLQPDELKVDKSFVMHMSTDENSAVIVRSTVELGHGLGLSVVAEGVEDQDTYDALAELGCDRIQGFLIGRPMPATALRGWLSARALPSTERTPA